MGGSYREKVLELERTRKDLEKANDALEKKQGEVKELRERMRMCSCGARTMRLPRQREPSLFGL